MNTPAAIAVAALMATIFAATSPSYGADSTGIMIFGEGTESCGAWLSDRQNASADHYNVKANAGAMAAEAWVRGFLSAEDIHGEMNLLADTDLKGANSWLDAYCAKNPLDPLSAAVAFLTSDLLSRASAQALRKSKRNQ